MRLPPSFSKHPKGKSPSGTKRCKYHPLNFPALEILHGQRERLFIGLAFDPCRLLGPGPSADKLRVGKVLGPREVSRLVHVPGNNDLGFPFHKGIVPFIPAHLAVGIIGATVVIPLRKDSFLLPPQRDVTKNDPIWRITKLRLRGHFLEPFGLLGAQLLKRHPPAKARVIVRLVLASVETDHRHRATPKGVKWPPVRRRNHFGHAIGPLAAHIVISPYHHQRAILAHVLPGGIEKGRHQPPFLMPVIAKVAIP